MSETESQTKSGVESGLGSIGGKTTDIEVGNFSNIGAGSFFTQNVRPINTNSIIRKNPDLIFTSVSFNFKTLLKYPPCWVQ